MAKTLIAYGTRYGATAEVSNEIAKILKDEFKLNVDVVNLRNKKIKGLSEYDNIIIASGIKMNRWVSAAKKFLKSNFEGKKFAVFVCSRRAGEPDQYESAYNNYVVSVIEKHTKFKPVASEAFGGRKPLANNQFYDNRDWEKIREWAKKVGELFSS
jgi:menaquinone-dependent protoporphyrinogen IX oxidase